jgi:DNA polymerase II
MNPKNFDYQHYIEKQLKPIADSLLMLFGKSFDNIFSIETVGFVLV